MQGDSLTVQTGEDQYSVLAVSGHSNKIKVGANGRTYQGNSVSYQSAPGGHSVYTWGDDPTPGPGPDDPVNPDVTLSRGQTGVLEEVFIDNEQVVMITNPFTGTNYTYTIKARDLTELSFFDPDVCDYEYIEAQRKNIKFEFLANGRLVIRGNYLDIKAGENQQDDIILLGNFNNLDTGNNDDIIRVGIALDSDNLEDDTHMYLTEAASHTEAGKITGNYTRINGGKGYQLSFQEKNKNPDGTYPFAYCAVGNHIKTGDGDDYVTMLLYQPDTTTSIDMGEGTDSFLIANGRYEYDTTRLAYTDSNLYAQNNLTNAEYIEGNTYVETTDANGNSLYDDDDGWARQGRLNDCRFLSYLNSICQVGTHKISDFVDIVENGANYTVTFKNYNPTTWGTSTNSVSIPKSEITSNTGNEYGDINTYILGTAFSKIIGINQDRGKTSSRTAHWNTYSRYFYGNDLLTWINTNELTIEKMQDLLAKFNSGEIDNLTTQITESNKKIGLLGGHEYTLKNLYQEENTNNYYVELINPADDRDILRLPWNIYKSYTGGVQVYGNLLYGKSNTIYSNGNL